jgi:hypothetical protein
MYYICICITKAAEIKRLTLLLKDANTSSFVEPIIDDGLSEDEREIKKLAFENRINESIDSVKTYSSILVNKMCPNTPLVLMILLLCML